MKKYGKISNKKNSLSSKQIEYITFYCELQGKFVFSEK